MSLIFSRGYIVRHRKFLDFFALMRGRPTFYDEKIPGDVFILMALQMQLCNWKADVIDESMLPLPSVKKFPGNLFTDRRPTDTSSV